MPYHARTRPASLPAWVTHARRASAQMRGKVKWEGMWVIFVECVAYAAGLVSPDADFVSIRLTNGAAIVLPVPPPALPPRPRPRTPIPAASLLLTCIWVERMRYATSPLPQPCPNSSASPTVPLCNL